MSNPLKRAHDGVKALQGNHGAALETIKLLMLRMFTIQISDHVAMAYVVFLSLVLENVNANEDTASTQVFVVFARKFRDKSIDMVFEIFALQSNIIIVRACDVSPRLIACLGLRDYSRRTASSTEPTQRFTRDHQHEPSAV